MMKTTFLAIMLVLSLALSGCGAPNRADVVGAYAVTVPYGAASLVLNANGTYSQTFKYNSGRIVSNSGRWSYGSPDADSLVLFNALTIMDNLGAPNYGLYREQSQGLSVQSLYGKPFIEFNDGYGWKKTD